MIGDGVKRYHHENDGVGSLVGGCHAEIVNTEHPIKAKIIYAANTLEVKKISFELMCVSFFII